MGDQLLESVRDSAPELYRALETMIRQNAGLTSHVGHDAIMEGRRVLAKASLRRGQKIDWAKEKLGVRLVKHSSEKRANDPQEIENVGD